MHAFTNLSESMLLIFGGLPASGKSTISKRIAHELRAVYIRVDIIEQTLRDSGFNKVYGEGYELAYRIAADNLALGLPVVADSVNAISITRDAWRNIGVMANVPILEIETVCSDQEEHKQRVETRTLDIDRLTSPTWNEVLARDYEPWAEAHIVIDTAGESPDRSFERILSKIKAISTI